MLDYTLPHEFDWNIGTPTRAYQFTACRLSIRGISMSLMHRIHGCKDRFGLQKLVPIPGMGQGGEKRVCSDVVVSFVRFDDRPSLRHGHDLL